MMPPEIFLPGPMTVIALALYFLERAAQRAPSYDEAARTYVLRHGLVMRFAGYLGAALALLFPALAFVFPIKDRFDVAGFVGGFVIMGLLSTTVLLEAFRARITLSDEGVRAFSPWRREQFIRWDQVQSVDYSPNNFCLMVEDGRDQHIRILDWLVGSRIARQFIETHVPPQIWRGKKLGR